MCEIRVLTYPGCVFVSVGIECPGSIDCLERVTASSWWQRLMSCLAPSAARSWPFRLDYVFVDLPIAPVAQDGSIVALCWTVVSGVARMLYDNLVRGLCARVGYGASDSAEAEFDVGGGDASASVDIEGGAIRGDGGLGGSDSEVIDVCARKQLEDISENNQWLRQVETRILTEFSKTENTVRMSLILDLDKFLLCILKMYDECKYFAMATACIFAPPSDQPVPESRRVNHTGHVGIGQRVQQLPAGTRDTCNRDEIRGCRRLRR